MAAAKEAQAQVLGRTPAVPASITVYYYCTVESIGYLYQYGKEKGRQ
jgi:hypothetical protein